VQIYDVSTPFVKYNDLFYVIDNDLLVNFGSYGMNKSKQNEE